MSDNKKKKTGFSLPANHYNDDNTLQNLAAEERRRSKKNEHQNLINAKKKIAKKATAAPQAAAAPPLAQPTFTAIPPSNPSPSVRRGRSVRLMNLPSTSRDSTESLVDSNGSEGFTSQESSLGSSSADSSQESLPSVDTEELVKKRHRIIKPYSDLQKSQKTALVSSVLPEVVQKIEQSLVTNRGSATQKDVAAICGDIAARATNKAYKTTGHVQAKDTLTRKERQPSVHLQQSANSVIVLEQVRTYINANDQNDKERKIRDQVLSALALGFSRKEMNEILFKDHDIIISEHYYKMATENALSMGSGRVADKVKIVRNSIDADMVGESAEAVSTAIEIVQVYLYAQACGTKPIKLDNGEEYAVPQMELTKSREEIKQKYREAMNEANRLAEIQGEQKSIVVSDSYLDHILKMLTGGKVNKNLVALDSNFAKYGHQNFMKLERLIDIITLGKDRLNAELKEMTRKCSDFLKNQYGNHIFAESNCKSHSKSHAFDMRLDSNQPEAPPDHNETFCHSCLEIDRLKEQIETAIQNADLKEEEESNHDLLEYFKYYIVPGMLILIGHIHRKYSEITLEQKVLDKMDKDTGVIIRVDYKMKLLSLVWRESMAQFFGKRGKNLTTCP